MEYDAHSEVDGRRHPLRAHLLAVGDAAASFASKFGAEELGRLAGLTHDVGKYLDEFQAYLRAPGGRSGPLHKHHGACCLPTSLYPVAWTVLGHHGGLPDRADVKNTVSQPPGDIAQVRRRAASDVPELEVALRQAEGLRPPDWIADALQLEVFTRMLFSALVDADGLDTERHFHPERSSRRGGYPDVHSLWERLREFQDRTPGASNERLNKARREVYLACVRAAERAPGFFRLTVPTGGGKTRSATAFALRHCVLHGLDRVIVVAPYTAIIEQTADVLRSILSHEAVVEHHSALELSGDMTDSDPELLAADNWDAPVIVTTTVQLFESLFSHRPGRCRKLHNVCRSVIILDEVQALPPGIVAPVIDMLRELVRHYSVTVLLCTATQPTWSEWSRLAGLGDLGEVHEIIPDREALFRELARVRYDVRCQPMQLREVAELMAQRPQALAVVNTRAQALELTELLEGDDVYHISTYLCGAHRRRVIREIRARLKGDRCRVVSTQTIEAGVDVDFPFVVRAVGPLDRIVQAAGRCNREGVLPFGECLVLTPVPDALPQGPYRAGADVCRLMIASGRFDPDDPKCFEEYFREWLSNVCPDVYGIQKLRRCCDYPEVSRRFRVIPDETVPVVVPYRDPERPDELDALLTKLRRERAPDRITVRRLQPYFVNVLKRRLPELVGRGLIEEVRPGLGVWRGDYDARVGIALETARVGDYVF